MRALLFALVTAVASHALAGLPIAPLERSVPVNFHREVLPFLRDNCLSCHSKSTTKGGLNLETPEAMLKGGESGPGVVRGKPEESLVLQAAAHLDADMKMPPPDNKAKARNLTPEQLALLRLWIEQGAKLSTRAERIVKWQPVPEKLSAIIAATVTADGQFAACSRANRIAIYHLPTARIVSNEVAHSDQVNALAFSTDGMLLASGGYREVKLWRRTRETQKLTIADAGTRLAVSADGKWLATGGETGQVKLWHSSDGKPGAVITAAAGAVNALSFSPDGTMLACATADKSLSLWSVADAKLLAETTLAADVHALAWLGEQLASAGSDGLIRLWKNALAPEKELAGHSGAVTALAAQGAQLLSGGADGSVRLWDVEKGQATTQIAHGGAVTAVGIRPDGKRFASAGANKLAKLWDASGKPVAELKGQRYLAEAAEERDRTLQIAAGTVAFRKEAVKTAETQLATAKAYTKKTVTDLPTKQQELEAKEKALAESRTAKDAAEQGVATSEAELKKANAALEAADKLLQQSKAEADAAKAKMPVDQAAIDKANANAAMRTQEAAKAKTERDQKEVQRKAAADKVPPAVKAVADADQATKQAEAARRQAVKEIETAINDEEKFTAAIPQAKAAVEAAEMARKKAEEDLQAAKQQAAAAELAIQTLSFSPDNQLLVTAGDDKQAHTWSAESGAAVDVSKAQQSAVTAVAFTSASEVVTVAANRSAVVWDLSVAWKLERTIGSADGPSPFEDRICALAFSHDGRLLATGGGEPSRGGEIKLWNPATGELIRDLPEIHSDAVLSLDFSRDDLLLLSGGADRMCRIVEVRSGKLTRTLEGHSHHVLGVSWSPDGRTIATAGADNTVKIWDAATGDRRKSIEGSEKEVTAVRFVGAGDKLLSASGDNKVRLMRPDGGQVIAFPDVTDFVNAAAVTADGRTVVAGGFDSVLRVWQAADGKPIATFAPAKK